MILDLNNPEFLDVFLALEPAELRQAASALRRLQGLEWSAVHRSKGLRWEAVRHIIAPNGQTVHSLRLSQKARALAYRDGPYLRLLSLHPDHDSADKS